MGLLSRHIIREMLRERKKKGAGWLQEGENPSLHERFGPANPERQERPQAVMFFDSPFDSRVVCRNLFSFIAVSSISVSLVVATFSLDLSPQSRHLFTSFTRVHGLLLLGDVRFVVEKRRERADDHDGHEDYHQNPSEVLGKGHGFPPGVWV